MPSLSATSYSVTYSNTQYIDCFTDSNDIAGISSSLTELTLTSLQEGTEYGVSVTAVLSNGEMVEKNIVLQTQATGKFQCFVTNLCRHSCVYFDVH